MTESLVFEIPALVVDEIVRWTDPLDWYALAQVDHPWRGAIQVSFFSPSRTEHERNDLRAWWKNGPSTIAMRKKLSEMAVRYMMEHDCRHTFAGFYSYIIYSCDRTPEDADE